MKRSLLNAALHLLGCFLCLLPALSLAQAPENLNILDFNKSELSLRCPSDGARVQFEIIGGHPPYTVSLTARNRGLLGTWGPETRSEGQSVVITELNDPSNRNIRLSVGTYELIVRDNKGCEFRHRFGVQGAFPFDIEIDRTNPLCAGDASGTIRIMAARGGVLGNSLPAGVARSPLDLYEFEWYVLQNVQGNRRERIDPDDPRLVSPLEIQHLHGGIYELLIFDKERNSGGCDDTLHVLQIPLQDPPSVRVNVREVKPITCPPYPNQLTDVRTNPSTLFKYSLNRDGVLRANATGGSAPYSFYWRYEDEEGRFSEREFQGQELDSLYAGTYYVRAIDVNGCADDASYRLEEPKPLINRIYSFRKPGGGAIRSEPNGEIEFSIETRRIDDLMARLVPEPDGDDYEPLESLQYTENRLRGIQPGTYRLQFVNSQGCLYDTTIAMENRNEGVITANGVNWQVRPACLNSNESSVEVLDVIVDNQTVVMPDNNFTFRYKPMSGATDWRFFSNGNIHNNLRPGSYLLEVKRQQPLTIFIDTFIVVENINYYYPEEDIEVEHIACHGDANGRIHLRRSPRHLNFRVYPYLYSSPEFQLCDSCELVLINRFGEPIPGSGSSYANLPAGDYRLRILAPDTTGCRVAWELRNPITVEAPDPLTIQRRRINGENISNEYFICRYSPHPSVPRDVALIDVAVSGGTPPYDFTLFRNGEIYIPEPTPASYYNRDEDQVHYEFDLPVGEYAVEIRDRNQCRQVDTFFVRHYREFTVTTEPNQNRCYQKGSIFIDVPQDGNDYYYKVLDLWEAESDESGLLLAGGTDYPVSPSSPENGITAGIYDILVNDSSTKCYNINYGTRVDLRLTPRLDICPEITQVCADADTGQVSLVITGGTPNNDNQYQITWRGVTTTEQVYRDLSAGLYELTVADYNTNTCSLRIEPGLEVKSLEVPDAEVQYVDGLLRIPDGQNYEGASFQWYYNGEPIPGATTREHQPAEVGLYALEITRSAAQGGCAGLSEPIEVATLSRGLTMADPGEITLFPNPASASVTLRGPWVAGTSLNLVGYDAAGRRILEQDLQTGAAKGVGFSVESLPPGLVQLEIRTEHRRWMKRLLIQR